MALDIVGVLIKVFIDFGSKSIISLKIILLRFEVVYLIFFAFGA